MTIIKKNEASCGTINFMQKNCNEYPGINSEEMFRLVFEKAPIGMCIVSLDGHFGAINQAMSDIVGYSEDEIKKKTFQEITYDEDLEIDLLHVNRLISGELDYYKIEKRYICKDGNIANTLLSVSVVRDKNKKPLFFISQVQDITEQKRIERELFRKSREDELTKVFNRRHFLELCTREVIRGARFYEPQALMMIDIDHFKIVNDHYGHDVGDKVLYEMAKECRASLRNVDIVGRLGGEEFAVFLLNSSQQIALQLAERLRSRIQNLCVKTKKGPINFTISIGLVTFTKSNLALAALLKKADEALYRAKETGRNKVVATYIDVDSCPFVSLSDKCSSFVRLEWSQDFVSGCERIDLQHQRLVLLANNLLGAIVSGERDAQVTSLVKELINEMVVHFQDEEKVLFEVGYPEATAHRRLHKKLIAKMVLFKKKYERKEFPLVELFRVLAIEIVKDHLIDEDRKFFSYVKSCNQ